jgi:hypothetical protein
MSERYRHSVCIVQIKSSAGNAARTCHKLAKVEASRLAAETIGFRMFECVTGERSNEEILIIADLGNVVPRAESVDRADGRGDTCSVESAMFRRLGPDFRLSVSGMPRSIE